MYESNYGRHAKRPGTYPHRQNPPKTTLTNFPLEKARLQITTPLLYISVVSMIAYEWTSYSQPNLPGPIIFSFLFGRSPTAAPNRPNALIVDLYRATPATATNLIRYLLSAIVIPMIDTIGSWGELWTW